MESWQHNRFSTDLESQATIIAHCSNEISKEKSNFKGLDNKHEIKHEIIQNSKGAVWYCYLNNSFYCLNIITCIFIIFFNLQIFL